MRRGYAIKDLFALQNFMETVNEFEPITDRVSRISTPTMILDGGHDFFIPRRCHEVLRKGIRQLRLVIVQHVRLAIIRLRPILPEGPLGQTSFAVALLRIEQENGRLVQTQIRLLKGGCTDVAMTERAGVIAQKAPLIEDAFTRFLASLAV